MKKSKWIRMPRICEVEPLDNLVLNATFECGTKKELDIKKYEDFMPFKPLFEDETLFNQARPSEYGVGIVWNNDIDIAHEEVWLNGTVI